MSTTFTRFWDHRDVRDVRKINIVPRKLNILPQQHHLPFSTYHQENLHYSVPQQNLQDCVKLDLSAMLSSIGEGLTLFRKETVKFDIEHKGCLERKRCVGKCMRCSDSLFEYFDQVRNMWSRNEHLAERDRIFISSTISFDSLSKALVCNKCVFDSEKTKPTSQQEYDPEYPIF